MKKGIKFSDLSVLNFILFFIFYFLSSLCEGRGSYISARVFPSEDPILSFAHIICCYLQAPAMEAKQGPKSLTCYASSTN